MLDWKLHFIFGLLFVIALLSFFHLINFKLAMQDIIVIIVLSSFASLFPDVDMQRSKIRGIVSLVIATAVAVMYLIFYIQTWYYAPVYFLLLYFIFKYLPSKHRGIAHTFKFSFFFSAVIALICYLTLNPTINAIILYFTVSFLGYSLHLILDKT